MTPDTIRIDRVTALMREAGFDALVCRLPHNVLMLSGYLPVQAQSIVVFLADGEGTLIAPESELFFAQDAWFRDIRTFRPATLDYVMSPIDVAVPLLAEVCCEKGVSDGVLGIERQGTNVTAPYLETYAPGCADHRKWAEAIPEADFRDASALLQEAEMVKSPREIERITIACVIARHGFEAARQAIRSGVREVEVASAAKQAMEVQGSGLANVRRVEARAFCMSGERSAGAHMPYQYSTNRELQAGDSSVVHINCSADGFWTDLTRTFFVDKVPREMATAYDAMLDAWGHAVSAVGMGVKAADVDAEARSALDHHGYAEGFLHGTGHGVGFRAIGHDLRPVIHPQSDDVLDRDMVFNIEPAVYLSGLWGMRVCDVVCVRGDEAAVLSDMRRDIEWATCE